jgi:AcrR family transcriptional regulator
MEAAVRAFARKGYHSTRVGEIAEEAGVAYGLVYHYFGSKKEVLEEIFRDTWTQMLARIRDVAASAPASSATTSTLQSPRPSSTERSRRSSRVGAGAAPGR